MSFYPGDFGIVHLGKQEPEREGKEQRNFFVTAWAYGLRVERHLQEKSRAVVDPALFHLSTFLLNSFTLKETGATSVPRCHVQRRGQLQAATL